MKTTFHSAASRGRANHGWLDSYHKFSFTNYQHAKRTNFGGLRVLNDDTLKGGMGTFVGGALSGIVSTSTPSNYRPIINYHNDSEFHTLKNCEQFNEHFVPKNADMKIDCEKDYNLNTIRKKNHHGTLKK